MSLVLVAQLLVAVAPSLPAEEVPAGTPAQQAPEVAPPSPPSLPPPAPPPEVAPVAPANPPPSSPPPAKGEPGTKQVLHEITLNDGQELRGQIVSETPERVVLELPSGGRVELTRSSIAKIETHEVTTGPDGQRYWFVDPNRTRYLYAPSAMMLRPGECYFSQKMLVFSAFGCGVHPNVTVLFGTALPAWLGGLVNAVGAVKVGMPLGGDFHVAGGFEAFLLPSFGYGGLTAAGFVFASATAGGANAHVTLSVGKPFFFSGGSPGVLGEGIFVLAGDYRLSPNIALVTENWFMPNLAVQQLVMLNGLALRFIGPKIAVDLGLIRVHTAPIPVPWMDLSYTFG